jgi:hypothetical protein
MIVGDDTTGGFLAPVEIINELIKGIVLFSPIRDVARVRNTSFNSVKAPKRTQTTSAVWVGEVDTRSETNNLKFGKEEISTRELSAMADISRQDLEDVSVSLDDLVLEDFAEQFGVSEGAAFVSGDGVDGKPEGFLTASDQGYLGSNGIETSRPRRATAVVGNDLIELFYTLKDAYARNASWLMKRGTVKVVRKLKETSTDNYLWQPGSRRSRRRRSSTARTSRCPTCPARRSRRSRPATCRSRSATGAAATGSSTASRCRRSATRTRRRATATSASGAASASAARSSSPKPSSSSGRVGAGGHENRKRDETKPCVISTTRRRSSTRSPRRDDRDEHEHRRRHRRLPGLRRGRADRPRRRLHRRRLRALDQGVRRVRLRVRGRTGIVDPRRRPVALRGEHREEARLHRHEALHPALDRLDRHHVGRIALRRRRSSTAAATPEARPSSRISIARGGRARPPPRRSTTTTRRRDARHDARRQEGHRRRREHHRRRTRRDLRHGTRRRRVLVDQGAGEYADPDEAKAAAAAAENKDAGGADEDKDEPTLASRAAAVATHAEANELAAELEVEGFEEKKPNLDAKRAALLEAAEASRRRSRVLGRGRLARGPTGGP